MSQLCHTTCSIAQSVNVTQKFAHTMNRLYYSTGKGTKSFFGLNFIPKKSFSSSKNIQNSIQSKQFTHTISSLNQPHQTLANNTQQLFYKTQLRRSSQPLTQTTRQYHRHHHHNNNNQISFSTKNIDSNPHITKRQQTRQFSTEATNKDTAKLTQEGAVEAEKNIEKSIEKSNNNLEQKIEKNNIETTTPSSTTTVTPPEPKPTINPTKTEAAANVEKVTVDEAVKVEKAVMEKVNKEGKMEPKIEPKIESKNDIKSSSSPKPVESSNQSTQPNNNNMIKDKTVETNPTQSSSSSSSSSTTIINENQPKLSKPPSKWRRRFRNLMITSFALVTVSTTLANPQIFAKWFHNMYRDFYIVSSPYESLYAYSNPQKHMYELTFKLHRDDLFHNISIYQLLILKDVFTLYQMIDDLTFFMERLQERFETPDYDSSHDLAYAMRVLGGVRNRVTANVLLAEVACRVQVERDLYPDLTEEEYFNKFKPVLHKLERHWCDMTAAKDVMEQLLPLLEKFTSELLLVETRNREAFHQPEYLRQVALNPDTLPPVKMVADIPITSWMGVTAAYEENLRDLYKTYISDVRMTKVPEPDKMNKRFKFTSWNQIREQVLEKAGIPLEGKGGEETLVKQQLQPTTRILSPQQISKRESSLRTSKKVSWRSHHERRLVAKIKQFEDESEALQMEQMLTQKVHSEQSEERKLRRQRQIEEKYAQIQRQDRVQKALERSLNRAALESNKDVGVVGDGNNNNEEHTLVRFMSGNPDGEISTEDQIALLKNQLTTEELRLFDQKHPETAHIKSKSGRMLQNMKNVKSGNIGGESQSDEHVGGGRIADKLAV